ncbi:MAG: DUF523 and DUF1722 domain-containing protein [Acidimicrobiia bacterium]|nr:DUF523 and DUF1722 domain-containing protein [Acidimicrobiia bacterium]
MAEAIRVGVSSCLLGQQVRYDGGHKRSDFVADILGARVTFVPVCPEVELGLGTPRPTLRLIRRGDDVRMVMADGRDFTDSMRTYARRRVERLKDDDLAGYVLKKDSPSCGLTRVKVYEETGIPTKSGRGVYAEALLERWPHLPVEEEGRLQDEALRENFLERVSAYHRLQELFQGRWTVGQVVAFHTAHKLAVLAHTTEGYRRLGRLVADAKAMDRAELREAYTAGLMQAMTLLATPKKHANVLMHMLGYFRGQIDAGDHEELLTAIEEFRLGVIPRIVPLTLIRHHVRRCGVAYLAGQTYVTGTGW